MMTRKCRAVYVGGEVSCRGVAVVGTLIFGDVLFKLVLVVLSLTSVGRRRRWGRWSVAECCWLKDSVLSLGMWVVGVG